MKLAVYGASGRMGKELVAAATSRGHQVCESTRAKPQADELLSSDVIIDFTTPEASLNLVNLLIKHQKNGNKIPALLVGTTGLNDEYFALAKQLECAYFWASNTSIGVAVLTELSKRAAVLLDGFDIEIQEAHHRYKKDAPSGTALSLAKEIANVKNAPINLSRQGERQAGEIGLSAIRGGDVAGRHVVGFYGDGEWLELQHFATSRSIFANGAVRIAAWLIEQTPGQYAMSDFIKTVL